MTARRDPRGPNLSNLGGHSNESSGSSRFCRGKRLIVKIRIDAKIHERKITAERKRDVNVSRAFLFYSWLRVSFIIQIERANSYSPFY